MNRLGTEALACGSRARGPFTDKPEDASCALIFLIKSSLYVRDEHSDHVTRWRDVREQEAEETGSENVSFFFFLTFSVMSVRRGGARARQGESRVTASRLVRPNRPLRPTD